MRCIKEKNYRWKSCRFLLFAVICITALFLADPAYAEEENTENNSNSAQQERQVNGFTAEKQTVRSIYLKWEDAENVWSYTLYQYKEKSRQWKAVKNLQQNFCVVKNLKPATVYKFRVSAHVSDGSVLESDILKTATVPEKTSINVRQAGFYFENYQVRVLICSAKKVKGASGYQYAYSRFRNKKYKTMKTKKWIQKIKLQKDRTYYFKVRAYKKVGDTYYYGEYSAPKPVRIR